MWDPSADPKVAKSPSDHPGSIIGYSVPPLRDETAEVYEEEDDDNDFLLEVITVDAVVVVEEVEVEVEVEAGVASGIDDANA